MAVKKRCNFCRKVLREDGTCDNPNCPRFVPENTEGDKAEDKDESTDE